MVMHDSGNNKANRKSHQEDSSHSNIGIIRVLRYFFLFYIELEAYRDNSGCNVVKRLNSVVLMESEELQYACLTFFLLTSSPYFIFFVDTLPKSW